MPSFLSAVLAATFLTFVTFRTFVLSEAFVLPAFAVSFFEALAFAFFICTLQSLCHRSTRRSRGRRSALLRGQQLDFREDIR